MKHPDARPRNRLAAETSPYLQQHAANPVDWYPWSDEAFAVARNADKPVLLSIGYSACHWCHVMAHESFEHAETAALMNELFVNVKVDREERPDIDKIYQTALALLTQQPGGWPLTMFLDPADQRPFFGGTYFPRTAMQGMPAFDDLLRRVAQHFLRQRAEIREQGEQLIATLDTLEPNGDSAAVQLSEAPLAASRENIAANFDREYGGIRGAPKFPRVATLDRLLRHWRASANGAEPDIEALFLVSLTLLRMAEGGIYDQLEGGFCRYSVDRYWQIPHFEKMLYDNGPLLALFAQTYLATGDAVYRQIAQETADYLLRDLGADNGGFYSTRDADSEGVEGRFYVWTPDEVRGVVGSEAYPIVAEHYGLDQPPNFEGAWHLTVRRPVGELAAERQSSPDALAEEIARARNLLRARRGEREPPGRDEKQLAAWNALAIRGFAIAGRALDRPQLVDAAADAANFVRERLFIDGRLRASYKDGRARFAAYLDDHAFLLDALLELLQARWSTHHLEFAIELAELLLKYFFDDKNGGFYFTASDAEALIHRNKPLSDDALPSGNGIAALALQRLGFLLGETRYLAAAERTLQFSWSAASEYPLGHDSLITALEEHLHHPEIIVIRGPSEETSVWQAKIASVYAPRRLVFAIDASEHRLPGALAARTPSPHGIVAYRCLGHECSLPIKDWTELAHTLAQDGGQWAPRD